MRGRHAVAIAVVAFIVVGLTTLGSADDKGDKDRKGPKGGRSDFALFDGTNPANVGSGAVCGLARKSDHPFTLHVTVTNFAAGAAGSVRVIYADGDSVSYPMAPNDKFQISLIGGSKGGADHAIRIAGTEGTQLVGQASILSEEGGKVFCVSCDADSAGDAACDAIIPDE
jgi:hypothetical protein